MILDTVEGKSVPRFLVYDIVRFEVSFGCIHWLFNWKREVIKTYFEMFPTKNLIWFLFYFLIDFWYIFSNSNSNKIFIKINI